MPKIQIPVRCDGTSVSKQTLVGLKFGSYPPTEFEFESDVCAGLTAFLENQEHLKEAFNIYNNDDDNDEIQEAKIKVKTAADRLYSLICTVRELGPDDERDVCDQLQQACSHLHHVSTIVVLPAPEDA